MVSGAVTVTVQVTDGPVVLVTAEVLLVFSAVVKIVTTYVPA